MKIAVVTGASSGIGREFVKQISQKYKLDQIWVIARREKRLTELRRQFGALIRPLPLDLTDEHCLDKYKEMLKAEEPDVSILVNCSGFGRFGNYSQVSVSDSMSMIDLNCKALVSMTDATIPYMHKGAKIFQLGSLSAFQPVPYLNVYAASKAFVLSYSRALNQELKPKGIKVLAVCPGWVKTEFFDHARLSSDSAVTYFNRIFEPKDIISTALKDMEKKNKDVSVHGFSIKAQILLVKLLSHRMVMKIWIRQQKHSDK